jgi:hypothetical protein
MTPLEVKGSTLIVSGNAVEVGGPILEARQVAGIVLVLIDPDSYLADQDYRRKRRSGLAAVHNLRAFSAKGDQLWAAEMPEDADYYHKIVSIDPIEVDSFSGFRCQIDPRTGAILTKRFMR